MMACVDTEKRAACAANHSCTPVSYTHLDVYKRQIFEGRIQLFVHDVDDVKSITTNLRKIAVSYTHLDVYKRQN